MCTRDELKKTFCLLFDVYMDTFCDEERLKCFGDNTEEVLLGFCDFIKRTQETVWKCKHP